MYQALRVEGLIEGLGLKGLRAKRTGPGPLFAGLRFRVYRV